MTKLRLILQSLTVTLLHHILSESVPQLVSSLKLLMKLFRNPVEVSIIHFKERGT